MVDVDSIRILTHGHLKWGRRESSYVTEEDSFLRSFGEVEPAPMKALINPVFVNSYESKPKTFRLSFNFSKHPLKGNTCVFIVNCENLRHPSSEKPFLSK